jgi:DNA mismatch repair protein MutH
MADLNEVDELIAKLNGHRESIEEKLLQEPEDDELRDMLEEVEQAISLLEAEDSEAPLGEVVQLEAKVAERLQK